jgi:c-di-GMP-binding flagellar brake protein YcgR
LIEGKRIILKMLEANEAKGRRKFVRARCADPQKASFNIKYGTKICTGTIHDISAAGMTYKFDKNLPLKSNEHLADVQLKLKGVLCRVAGTCAGEVKEGVPRTLLMFDQPLAADTKEKLHRFIFHTLQEDMTLQLGKR